MAGSSRAAASAAPSPTPTVVNSEAHWYLKTPVPEELTEPLRAVPCGRPLLSGAREYDRSFQVMSGTIASSRLVPAAASKPAAANWIWPPYEPPVMPTCGSYCTPVVASSRATWSMCTGWSSASSWAAIVGSPPRKRMS